MPWAIYTDLSGVAELKDGKFETELDAIQGLILHLESNKTDIAVKIAKAKAARLRITRRTKYAPAR